jgi:ankyrin repeat protein
MSDNAPHRSSNADAALPAEQLELLSIADFNNFLREPDIAYLHRAILHGTSAVGTTPPHQPQRAARLKRLQNRTLSSFERPNPPAVASQAASRQLTDSLQLLLDVGAGVDFCADGNRRTLLHLAAKNGHDTVVRMLLGRGADANANDADGRTALHLAAEQGHDAIARVLCENGADVHAKMKSMYEGICGGNTALHCAAWHGREAMVRTLLDIGADVDEEDRWDARTPLHLAAMKGHEGVVRLLLESGAAVDGSLNNDDGSPLVSAAADGLEAVVRLLLSQGANVHVTDADGDPALLSAAYHGHEGVVRLLLDHGADPAARGGSGRTAQWYATERGHQAVSRLLPAREGDSQHQPDMQNDSHQCLVTETGGQLFKHIERAQQLMFHESEIQHWVQNLRFVVPVANVDGCDFDFELIESSAGDDDAKDEPYIAVSYCWATNSSKDVTLPRIRVPSKNQLGAKETREVRAPPNILRRSLEFAAARGIKKVWIDQECIHQDDEEDKKVAIQCMHLVYRQAAITLIILGDHVRTAEDVPAISNIMQHAVHEEMRDRILGDRWFSRAWTTQEYANSTRERLSYLVCWKDGIDIAGGAWQLEATAFNSRRQSPQQNIRRAWELTQSDMFAISCMSMRHTQVMLSMSANAQFAGSAPNPRTFRLLDQDLQAGNWWKGER